MPRTACRVVCGLDEVITIFWPTRAFVSVDLPAFGRPTKQAKPDLNSATVFSVEFSGVDDITNLSVAIGNDYWKSGAAEIADHLDIDRSRITVGDHRGGLDAFHA